MSAKILIVDDDPTIIPIVESILKPEGYETISASNGVEALSKIKEENPDLLVLDIEMPEKNGYDVCSELRFNAEYEPVPIVLLTSRDQELDPEVSAGLHIEYMQKPVDKEGLLTNIAKLLSRKSSGDEA